MYLTPFNPSSPAPFVAAERNPAMHYFAAEQPSDWYLGVAFWVPQRLV